MSSIIQEMKDNKSSTGIPLKILKGSSLRLDESLTDLLKNTVHTCVWPIELGSADITLTLKRNHPKNLRKAFVQKASSLPYQKPLKNFSMMTCINLWKINFPHFYADL